MGIYVSPIMEFQTPQPFGAKQQIKAVAKAKDDEATRDIWKRQSVYLVLGDEHALSYQ